MTSRIATYSRVTLRTDRFRDQGVGEGAVGYVIEVYDGGAYEVEFSDPNGVTIAQVVAREGELQVSEPHPRETLTHMPLTLTISLLADHPDAIPSLADAFRTRWPDYFAGRTLDEIADDFMLQANRSQIPIRQVAHLDGELAGTIVLRNVAMAVWPDHRPALGGLLVFPQFRGRGIGTALVEAGMETAHHLGFPAIYTATAAAAGILQRLGWCQIAVTEENGVECGLYRYTF